MRTSPAEVYGGNAAAAPADSVVGGGTSQTSSRQHEALELVFLASSHAFSFLLPLPLVVDLRLRLSMAAF